MTVTLFPVEFCPTGIFPQESEAGEMMSPLGAAVPVPVKDAVVGDPGASCDTVNTSARVPVAVGPKATWMPQLEPVARVLGDFGQVDVVA